MPLCVGVACRLSLHSAPRPDCSCESLRSDGVCIGCAVWCLGFGSYLEGLTTIGYNLTGGDSTPGNVGIYDANSAKSIIGYGLCIIFIGALALTPAHVGVLQAGPMSAALSAVVSCTTVIAQCPCAFGLSSAFAPVCGSPSMPYSLVSRLLIVY